MAIVNSFFMMFSKLARNTHTHTQKQPRAYTNTVITNSCMLSCNRSALCLHASRASRIATLWVLANRYALTAGDGASRPWNERGASPPRPQCHQRPPCFCGVRISLWAGVLYLIATLYDPMPLTPALLLWCANFAVGGRSGILRKFRCGDSGLGFGRGRVQTHFSSRAESTPSTLYLPLIAGLPAMSLGQNTGTLFALSDFIWYFLPPRYLGVASPHSLRVGAQGLRSCRCASTHTYSLRCRGGGATPLHPPIFDIGVYVADYRNIPLCVCAFLAVP